MKKFQLYEDFETGATAGSKAQNDIHSIAEQCGYSDFIIQSTSPIKGKLFGKIIKRINRAKNWLAAYFRIPPESVVLWQGPNSYTNRLGFLILRALKRQKAVKLIALLHDIDELRMEPCAYLLKSKRQHDFILKYADAVIVHNKKMALYLTETGVAQENLVSLGIFDYLSNGVVTDNACFEKSITLAGNLDCTKAAYLKELSSLNGIHFHLYGPNYSLQEAVENISYHGVVKPEELPSLLTKGFGLVWDGNSVSTCEGTMGQYLRYNNPHKLSLYLSAGLPVVLWNQAAEADFVKQHSVGICVSSLNEAADKIACMLPDEYSFYAQNARKISAELRKGRYLSNALRHAEELLQKNCNF